MTRKDYVAVAKILKAAQSVDDVKTELAGLFKRENPAFDKDRFFAACESQS